MRAECKGEVDMLDITCSAPPLGTAAPTKELAHLGQSFSATWLRCSRESMKYAPAQMGAEQGTANA